MSKEKILVTCGFVITAWYTGGRFAVVRTLVGTRRDLDQTLFGIKLVQGEDPSHRWLCNHCMIHRWKFRCRQNAWGKRNVISTKLFGIGIAIMPKEKILVTGDFVITAWHTGGRFAVFRTLVGNTPPWCELWSASYTRRRCVPMTMLVPHVMWKSTCKALTPDVSPEAHKVLRQKSGSSVSTTLSEVQTPSTGLRHPALCRKAMLGVWARCRQNSNSKHWFATSFLVPESDARSVSEV